MSKFSFLENNKIVIFILLIISSLFLLPLLGSYPLLGQWEPHYGRVAVEMMANKSWDWFLDPVYLGQHRFWSKPIFCFWMVFPFIKILGPTELAMRLPFALTGIAGVVLVWYAVKRLFNDSLRGFVSALIMLFLPYYYMISRQFMWDIPLIVFNFVAVVFIFVGARDNDKKLTRIGYGLFGIIMLTKGLLSIILPGGIFLLWMFAITDYSGGLKSILKQYATFFKQIRFFEGVGIFLLVSAWWYIYMIVKHGMPYFMEFFVRQHFGRMLGEIKKPDGPFEYYLWQGGLGFFPWVGFLVPALLMIGSQKENKKEERFMVMSFFFIVLFFTVSATKFPHYIAPASPFLAVILAVPFIHFFFDSKKSVLYPITAVLAALLIGVIAKDLGSGMNYRDLLYIITTHRIQKWFGRVADLRPWIEHSVPVIIVFILLPMVYLKSALLRKISLAGFFISTIVFASYINFKFIPDVLHVFTPKKLVEKYKELKHPGDIIIDYHNWKNRSMYFYLGLDEPLYDFNSASSVVAEVKKHPNATVFITMKKNYVPELRQKLLTELQVPLKKVMDDRVGSYMEIELYKTSLKLKGKIDDSWKKNIITQKDIPADITFKHGTLGGKSVEIIGYKLNKYSFDPKDKLVLDVYFKVLKKIKNDYRLFVHFDVYRGALPYSFKIDEYPLKGFYPTVDWKVGDIIKERFEKIIPAGHPGGGIKIYMGFFRGSKRMKVDENKFNDGENRFILGTFNINIH